MIDYWKLVQDFKKGDAVFKFLGGAINNLSPFVGSVLAVYPSLGMLDVQWPFGVERVYPTDVSIANPKTLAFLPTTLNQAHNTIEYRKAISSHDPWAERNLPMGFYVHIARQLSETTNTLKTYDAIYNKYGVSVSDEIIKHAILKLSEVSDKISNDRLQQEVKKKGAYWVSQNRQYRVTQEEIDKKKPSCPKCTTNMRKATYKMRFGEKHRLWVCPKCIFLVKDDSFLGPDGDPVSW